MNEMDKKEIVSSDDRLSQIESTFYRIVEFDIQTERHVGETASTRFTWLYPDDIRRSILCIIGDSSFKIEISAWRDELFDDGTAMRHWAYDKLGPSCYDPASMRNGLLNALYRVTG